MTTPIRTAWDLGRLVHRDRAMGGMDALARLRTFDRAELIEGVGRFAGRRGVVQLRALAPLVDRRAESPGESVLRLRWLDMSDLPTPTPQVPIMVDGVERYRVDLGLPALKYGCEYDGVAFHEDEQADVLRREDLLRRFGWHVEGMRMAQVFGSTRDVDVRIRHGIEAARRRLGHPRGA